MRRSIPPGGPDEPSIGVDAMLISGTIPLSFSDRALDVPVRGRKASRNRNRESLIILTHSGGRISACFHLRISTDAKCYEAGARFRVLGDGQVLCVKIR